MLSLSKHRSEHGLSHWLDERARAHPERLAIACGATRLTFAALVERAASVSGRLRSVIFALKTVMPPWATE